MTEAEQKVWALANLAADLGDSRAQLRHLDRLVDERAAQAKRGRLEREPLTRLASEYPMFGVGTLAKENRDSR